MATDPGHLPPDRHGNRISSPLGTLHAITVIPAAAAGTGHGRHASGNRSRMVETMDAIVGPRHRDMQRTERTAVLSSTNRSIAVPHRVGSEHGMQAMKDSGVMMMIITAEVAAVVRGRHRERLPNLDDRNHTEDLPRAGWLQTSRAVKERVVHPGAKEIPRAWPRRDCPRNCRDSLFSSAAIAGM